MKAGKAQEGRRRQNAAHPSVHNERKRYEVAGAVEKAANVISNRTVKPHSGNEKMNPKPAGESIVKG